MDFSKFDLIFSNITGYNKNLTSAKVCNRDKNDCNQSNSEVVYRRNQSDTLPISQKLTENQQHNRVYQRNQSGGMVTVDEKEILSYNLINNEDIEDKKSSPREVTKNFGYSGYAVTGEKEDTITTKEKRFDLSNLFSSNTVYSTCKNSVTAHDDEPVTAVTSPFDELGYVSEKYDHLSDQYQSQPVSFWSRYTKQVEITPQQALGIEKISNLERQISDFLRKNRSWSIDNYIAKTLNRSKQDIRQAVQNSALIEYRKVDDYEGLLLKEVNYPAHFVAFVESLKTIDLDDLLQLLEKIESYLKQHGQDHLDDWVKFCTRFVIYHKDTDNPVASLRKALIYQL